MNARRSLSWIAGTIAIVESVSVLGLWLIIARTTAMPSERSGYRAPAGPGYIASQAGWAFACLVMIASLTVAALHLWRPNGVGFLGAAAVGIAILLNLSAVAVGLFASLTAPPVPMLGILATSGSPLICAALLAGAWRAASITRRRMVAP